MNETLKYIKESKIKIILLISILMLGLLTGILTYPFLKDITRLIAEQLKSLVSTEDQLQTTLNILSRNIQATLITMILSPTIILPLIIIYANGLIAGLITHMAIEKGKTPGIITLSLIPHGIPELTAFLLTTSRGMDIGLAALNPQGKSRITATAEAIKKAVKTYITITIPLLIIAAFTETYISTQIIQ
jgi:stage II sporulation protein M